MEEDRSSIRGRGEQRHRQDGDVREKVGAQRKPRESRVFNNNDGINNKTGQDGRGNKGRKQQ